MMLGGLGMGLVMLLVVGLPLVLLVGGGAAVVRLLTNQSVLHPQGQHNPRQILDARLASGEIDHEEYDTLRSRLEA